MPFEVKDSGKREEFPSGAVRDVREGKGDFDLVSPMAIRRIAVIYQLGAKKYGRRNYEKGMPIMRFLDSALRHIYSHIEGDRSEDHLAMGAWNIMSAIHMEEMIERGFLPKELDDRPSYMPKTERKE